MAGTELSETVKVLVILHILLDGMNQRDAAVAAGVSLESANKVWREFCNLVTLNGLNQALESTNSPGAVELAELAREMRRHRITPQQCNQVLPLVVIFRNLKLDPHLIPDLLEAALQLGGKEFPRDEYASIIARIRRREKQTGLTVEQVDATHQAGTDDVERLRAETSRLQTTITSQQSTITNQQNTLANLRNESSSLAEESQGKQRRVDALDARIAKEGTTLQELKTYSEDKPYFENLGLDIKNAHNVRSVFTCFAALGYDLSRIINAITQISNLQTAAENLYRDIGEKQRELQATNAAKETVQKEIQNLQEKKKDEEKRVEQARLDADRKIAEIRQDLNVKENLLTAYVEDRENLRRLGVKI